MNKFFSLNFLIPAFDDDFIRYDSNSLLSDADIIVVRPPTTQAQFNFNPYWYEEIIHVLDLGKTVVVLLTDNQPLTYGFLPQIGINFISATGIEVFPRHKLIEPLYNAFKEFWLVRSYLTIVDNNSTVLMASKHNDRILAASTIFKNGHLIFLPYPNFGSRNLKYPNSQWNDLAETIGKSFKKHLSDIHNSLTKVDDASIKPEWSDYTEFDIQASVKMLQKIEENLEIIGELDSENERLFEIVKEKELLKNLLFETGKALEIAVIRSLKILGYSAENYDDGILELDQVIISPEGDRFIGECEGKDNKAIDVTKFRQLQDNLNEDFQRDDIQEKAFGLLFGNPQRFVNPAERDSDFTLKCKSGALREKIGLINTVNLFQVARYLSENSNDEFKLKCRSAIKEQLGKVVVFPSVPVPL